MSWTTVVGTAVSWLSDSNRCRGLSLSKSDAAKAEVLELAALIVMIALRCAAVTLAQLETDVKAATMESRMAGWRSQTLTNA